MEEKNSAQSDAVIERVKTVEEETRMRRQKVLSLRLRKQSIPQIAAALGVGIATISRDLDWIRAHWATRYGVQPQIDPAEVIGEAMATYEEAERTAYLEMAKLSQVQGLDPVKVSRAKQVWSREAREAKRDQIMLLQDLGIIERALGTITLNLPRASDIRRIIREAVVSEDALIPEAERQRRQLPDLVVDATP